MDIYIHRQISVYSYQHSILGIVKSKMMNSTAVMHCLHHCQALVVVIAEGFKGI